MLLTGAAVELNAAATGTVRPVITLDGSDAGGVRLVH